MDIKIGIIGGTGLDDPSLLEDREELQADTPFGKPSGPLIAGKIKGVRCVLLCRHGMHHELMPSNVNFRANVYALRAAGCSVLLATTATGSLRQEIEPGHFVLLDQFIDMTRHRKQTFYDGSCPEFRGILHLPMHQAFCPELRQVLEVSAKAVGIPYHGRGTVLVVEGPRFSSRAESHVWRQWGADVINMTSCPEVVLANELGLPYASVAMATDYDCWKEGEEVGTEKVFATLKANAHRATQLLVDVIPRLAQCDWNHVRAKMQETVQGSTIGGNEPSEK